MDCERIQEAIYLSFDNEIDAASRERLESHLASCSPCARRRNFTGNFLILLRRRVVRLAAPPELRRRILQSLPHRQQTLEGS